MNIGYNDMNTNAPQPFLTPGPIVISGGARPKMRPAVMPPPQHFRLQGAGVQDDVEKAMKQLKSFMDGKRKTKPAKKMLEILEKEGIISKMTGGYKSTAKAQIEDADLWTDYAIRTGDKGIGLARRGYDNAKDAMNPVQSEAKKAAKQVGKFFGGYKSTAKEQIEDADAWTDYAVRTGDKGIGLVRRGYDNYKQATAPVKTEANKAVKKIGSWFGGEQPKKSPSQWIMFVKDFAQKNNIPYKEALKAAGPHYRKLKGSGYSSVN